MSANDGRYSSNTYCAGSNDAADCQAAKVNGRIVPMAKPKTIADGLQARLGNLTWPQIEHLVANVITVSDEEIVAAMKLMFERMKVTISPYSWCVKRSSIALSPIFPSLSFFLVDLLQLLVSTSCFLYRNLNLAAQGLCTVQPEFT